MFRTSLIGFITPGVRYSYPLKFAFLNSVIWLRAFRTVNKMDFDNTINQFFIKNDECEEDLGLEEEARGKMHVVEMTNWMSKWIHPFTIEPRGKMEDHASKYVLQFFNPLDLLFTKDSKKIPLLNKIQFLFYGTTFTISLLSCLLIVRFEGASVHYNPMVKAGTNRTDICAIKGNIYESYGNYYAEMQRLYGILTFMGFNFTASISISLFSILVSVVSCFTVFVFLLAYSKESIALNYYELLTNPRVARQKLKMRLSKIIYEKFERGDKEEMMQVKYLDSTVRRSSNFTPERVGVFVAKNCSCKYSENMDRKHFVRFINRERILDFVQPECATVVRVKEARALVRKFAFATVVFIVFSVSLLVYRVVTEEISGRIEQRFNEFKCKFWHPNGTVIRNPLMLLPFESDEYLEYYRNHDGSMKSYLRLIIIELKLLLSIKHLMYYDLELLFLTATLTWGACYWYQFGVGYFPNRIWLRQVRSQLETCLELLVLIHPSESGATKSSKIAEDLEMVKRVLRRRFRVMEKALAITYLNFEIFLAEFHHYREVVNFLAGQLILASTLCTTACSLISTGLTSTSILWEVALSNLFILNIFVLVCSNMTSDLMELNRLVSEIMAKFTHNSMELIYIAKLWRRRLMTDSEVKSLYSIETFGVKLSHKNLLTFNTSLLGIYLLLNRSSQSH